MKIVFRCDGDNGKLAGLGHVYRQIEIYKNLKNIYPNINFIFLMKPFKEGIELVKKKTKANILIYNNDIIKNFTFFFDIHDIFILDTNSSNRKILNVLKKNYFKNIVLFEYTGSLNLPKCIIINGIYFAKKKLISSKKVKIYQNSKYLILRDQFKKKNKIIKNNKIKKILISSGGADHQDFLYKFFKKNYFENVEITIILGFAAKKKLNKINKLKFIKKRNVKLKVLYNVKNMFKIMNESDLNIVSGGTVMFESLCTTTPTAVVQTYFHQSYAINYFKKKKLIYYLGNHNELSTKKINFVFNKLISNKLKKRSRSFLDAMGKDRVLKIIKSNFLDK